MAPLDTALPAGSALPKRRSQPLTQLIATEAKRRRRRRVFWWSFAFVVPALVVAVWFATRPRPVPLAARYRVQPVSQGDVVRVVHATGHVDAVTTVQVGAEISGRILTVDVDYNDRVKAGQVLARFDRAALEAQLAQITATIASARAALAQAQTDRDQANRNLARSEQLYASKSISDAERDNSASAASVARQRVDAAESQVIAQQAAYSLAKTNLDHTVIRAPIDGVIITRNVDPGQTVASVFQTPVLFSVAADLRRMEVVAAVDEADIGEVKLKQVAKFTVNAYPDRTFEGVVTEVRNSPVIVQDVVTYGTVVEVDNLDLALKPGMTASVRIEVASARNAVRLPAAALRFTPPGETARTTPGAWTIEGAALRRVDVTPDISDGELTSVLAGIEPGTSVIVDLTPDGRKAYGLAH